MPEILIKNNFVVLALIKTRTGNEPFCYKASETHLGRIRSYNFQTLGPATNDFQPYRGVGGRSNL